MYRPNFIEGMTIEDLTAEKKDMYYRAYRYGNSIDNCRMWDIEFTISILEGKQDLKAATAELIDVCECAADMEGVTDPTGFCELLKRESESIAEKYNVKSADLYKAAINYCFDM